MALGEIPDLSFCEPPRASLRGASVRASACRSEASDTFPLVGYDLNPVLESMSMPNEWMVAVILRQELSVIYQADAAFHPSNDGNISIGIPIHIAEHVANSSNCWALVWFRLSKRDSRGDRHRDDAMTCCSHFNGSCHLTGGSGPRRSTSYGNRLSAPSGLLSKTRMGSGLSESAGSHR